MKMKNENEEWKMKSINYSGDGKYVMMEKGDT